MKIRKSIQKGLVLAGWAALLMAFVVLMVAASKNQKTVTIEAEPDIRIDYDIGHHFIDEGDVMDIINARLPAPITTYSLDEVNLGEVEQAIMENPYVKSAEVFISQHGNLVVDILQREPLLRVINSNGVSYYLDKTGSKTPITSKFTSRVPVCTGFILGSGPDTGQALSEQEKALFKLGKFLYENRFWSAFVDQIYINSNGELELIPKIERHSILIGDAENLEGKFEKLFIFYREGLRYTGWDQYELVDLRFENQVVCKKR